MDGCDKSRSPRRSTLLAGATVADAGAEAGTAAGGSDVDCIGGTGGTAADSNGWKSPPLGLQNETISCQQILTLPRTHTRSG